MGCSSIRPGNLKEENVGGGRLAESLMVPAGARRQDPARAADGVLGESRYARVLTAVLRLGRRPRAIRPSDLKDPPS
jgi:hypothetical protein